MIHIAICDDSKQERQILAALFKRYQELHATPLQIHIFQNGFSLLDAIDQGKRFDITILDILMPGENGIEIARNIRASGTDTEIIFLTSSPEYAVDSYEVKAQNYLMILCVFNNEYLGMVRQWQKLFYGKRYSMTNLRSGALSRRTNGEEYPEYTPDFVKLAESYGAKGIRVFNKTEVAAAFEEAKKNTKVPTLIEFVIDPEEMVYPMVKPGGTLADLIMDC